MQNAMVAVMDPGGVSPAEDLQGSEGEVQIRAYTNANKEAMNVALQIGDWLESGVSPAEIAVLVRVQADLYAAPLMAALHDRGIAYSNEQSMQDLAAEPAADLILNLLRVVLDKRQPEAYQRLMRIAGSFGVDEDASSRARSAVGRYLSKWQNKVKEQDFDATDLTQYQSLVHGFVELLGSERIATLSSDYQQGSRLNDVIDDIMKEFEKQHVVDYDPSAALRRLSGMDSIRILTVHKSKGLEFQNVIMLAIENETYWGNLNEQRSTFFVGISRAKDRLILTTASERSRPTGAKRWEVVRTPHSEFLSYAVE